MAAYKTDVLSPLQSSGIGNGMRYFGSAAVSANLATNDTIDLVRVAGGTLVDRVVVKVPDLDSGTALQAKIGFTPADGSAAPSGADVAVAAAGAWAQAAATTTYEIFPPYEVAVDSFLRIAVTAGGTGTGTVYGKVEGAGRGVK